MVDASDKVVYFEASCYGVRRYVIITMEVVKNGEGASDKKQVAYG